jgi:carbon starvation protein
MFTVTLASLGLVAWKNYQEKGYVLAVIAALLFILAISLIFLAFKSLKSEVKEPIKAL